MLIQPHSDFSCPARYPNLTEKTKKKIQIMKNKCMRFCLILDKMQHISLTEFRSINWLPTKERVHHCINAITSKFFNNNRPFYLNEIFIGQKTLSYIGLSLWNNLPEPIEKTNYLNTIKRVNNNNNNNNNIQYSTIHIM